MSIRKQLLSAILAGSLTLSVTAALACGVSDNTQSSDEPVGFLAIQAPAASTAQARLTSQDKTIVARYIEDQIKANNLTEQQFSALTPEQQREVLLPGNQFNLTREERRAIVPMKKPVPYEVSQQVQTNNTLSADIVSKYGLSLPKSVEARLPALPQGSKRILIGTSLVIINTQNTIQDVINSVY